VLSGDKFSKAADVFSLGITILEIAVDLDVPATGALFEDLRSEDRQRLPDKLMERAGLSDDLVQIIRDMLRPDPRKRPTVDDLLSRPAVQKVAGKRKLFVDFCEVVSTLFFLHARSVCFARSHRTLPSFSSIFLHFSLFFIRSTLFFPFSISLSLSLSLLLSFSLSPYPSLFLFYLCSSPCGV
jgi:serine/threonine protein kinase